AFDVELADGDKPVALGERQPAENYRVHHGEDRGCCTDAQRQHRERHARERRCPSQRTDGMASVAPKQVEPDRADFMHRLCHLCQTTEIAQRRPSRLDGRYPTAYVRLDILIDVKSEFVVYFGTDSAASSDSPNTGDESCEHAGNSMLTNGQPACRILFMERNMEVFLSEVKRNVSRLAPRGRLECV